MVLANVVIELVGATETYYLDNNTQEWVIGFRKISMRASLLEKTIEYDTIPLLVSGEVNIYVYAERSI